MIICRLSAVTKAMRLFSVKAHYINIMLEYSSSLLITSIFVLSNLISRKPSLTNIRINKIFEEFLIHSNTQILVIRAMKITVIVS